MAKLAMLLSLLCLAGTLLAQASKPADAAAAGRKVGGSIVFVQKAFSSPLAECVVSRDGSTSVVITEDKHVHFVRLLDWLAAKKPTKGKAAGKGKKDDRGKNDNRFRYAIEKVKLSADGTRLIGRINSSTLAVLDKRPRVLQQFRGMPNVHVFALHPDGKQLVAGMIGGLLRVWDTTNGKPVRYITSNDKRPSWVGFSKDGGTLILATEDRKLRYFAYPDMRKGHVVDTLGPIRNLSFTADGKTMVSQSGDAVQVWDVGSAAGKSTKLEKRALRVAVRPDGTVFVVAHEDGTVALHDAKSGERRFSWQAHPGKRIVQLDYVQPKGQRLLLVTAARGGDVVYWNLALLANEQGAAVKKRKPGAKKKRRRRKQR